MLHPSWEEHNGPLQSRNTPSKDALPLATADGPPRTPREWRTPPFEEGFAASNTKPLAKKEDAAKTSMLINREALTKSFSLSRASSPGISGPLVASLAGLTNASPSVSPKALLAGAEETSVVVMVAVARKESEIPRQKSAIPVPRSPKARILPTLTLPSPRSLGGNRR